MVKHAATDDTELVSVTLMPPRAAVPAGSAVGSGPESSIVPAKVRAARATGLRRLRLEEALQAGLWDRRLALVVAPAGAGKTTLLAQFAADAGVPAAWYQLDASDGDPAVMLGYLEAAIREVLPTVAGGWQDVAGAVRALEARPDQRVLLVVDDLHVLQGTPAEAIFEQLLAYRPPSLAILAAARRSPGLSLLSRLQVAGELLELGADDLRFRSWEVERLFAEQYRRDLPPQEAGELARRTEGWAAGLQMYHLATAAKTPAERRQTLAALGRHSRLAREYLARNVLDDLPGGLRSFLLQTCVLGRLSGALCDKLLDTTGSGANLAELERRQVFTVGLELSGYRYHEALRAHLEGVLREELGPVEARGRYRRAAGILEAAGHATEALQAWCRAEDWAEVDRLLGQEGEVLTTAGTGDWLSLLPASLGAHDPWVLLATARRLRATGRWQDALEAYRAAEEEFGTQAGSQAGLESAAAERLALTSWLDRTAPAPDWSGLLRAATAGNPLAVPEKASGLPGPYFRLASGFGSLVAGDLCPARSSLLAAIRSDDASPELVAGALVGYAVALALNDDPAAKAAAESASRRAESLGLPWLARMGQAVLALTDRPDGRSEAAATRLFCEAQGDRWGACLAGLLEGLGELRSGGSRVSPLDEAAEGFAQLGAQALEAWCLCTRAGILALAGDGAARAAAEVAERKARLAGLRGPRALAFLALARTDAPHGAEFTRWASLLAEDSGFALLGTPPRLAAPPAPAGDGFPHPPAAPVPPPPAPVRLRCFGGFRLEVGPDAVDQRAVKPRARKLLHLLALHGGQPVHREVLIEALWPEAEPDAGARNLHVAVSAVRQLLGGDPCRGVVTIEREGEDYRLAPPAPAQEGGPPVAFDADVVTLASLAEEGQAREAAGDWQGAIAAFSGALAAHTGDLLPEDGPDEWVVRARDRFRAQAVDAARHLADLHLAAGQPVAAVRACELGLDIDPARDELWRRLQHAHFSAGNHAAAATAQRRYEQVLGDLGLT